MKDVFDHLERARLATLPTPLEAGPTLDGGPRLWVKRDDLTGLGGGGNKARKLEFLCGDALVTGARALVTVGAAQSNHCRMTAAAGARLGLEVHLVLSGDRPAEVTGNQLLSMLFGAQLHFTGAEESHWGELEMARESLTDQLAEEGADLKEIARRGATAYLEMIFRDRIYHADPHPGNILALPGNVIGLLDFGMVGHLDNRTNEIFEELIHGFLLKDGELLADCLLMLGHAPPDIDRDKLQADIEVFIAANLTDSIKDMDTSRMFVGLTDIVRRHRIVQNPSVSLLIKVLVMLEGSSRLLDSDFNLSELLEPFYEKMIQRKLAPKNVFRRVQRTYRDWDRLFQSLPRDLADVLQRFRKGTLDVHLEHRHLDTVINRIAYGLVTAAVFLGSAMVLSRAIPPTFQGASIPGIAGIAFSLWLVRRLFRAIKKSGGL